MVLALIIGGYVVVAAAFYAFCVATSQPEPVPVVLRVVEGGAQPSTSSTDSVIELDRAA